MSRRGMSFAQAASFGKAPETPKSSKIQPHVIRIIARGVSEANRIPESAMLDTILRDYWRMRKPSKNELLEQYRERCDTTLPTHWKDHHCQMAAFLESILSEGKS